MSTEAGKFVKDSYDNNNDFAINIVQNFLINKGYTITTKIIEDYNIDIEAKKDNITKLFEVEVKTGYKFTNRESFKFNTVSFLARKKKWNINKGFFYIIICKETDWALVAKSEDIFKNEYKESLQINSYYRKGNDEFYRVPKELCKFFKIR
jgi:hypothetical protein